MAFAQIDCGKDNDYKKLCIEHEADHYPELVLWQDGELQELTFPRVKPAILSYIDKHMSPVSESLSCDSLKEKLEAQPFSLVHFGTRGTNLYNSFVDFGKFERDQVAHVYNYDTDSSCATEYGA